MTRPADYTEEEWTAFVNAGKQLMTTEQSQAWAWGDIANEHCPVGRRGVSTGGALQAWLEEIGYEGEVGTVRERRAVSAAWPNEIRISFVPWSIHQILKGLEDRAEVIRSRDKWTASEARAFVASREQQERDEVQTKLEIAGKISDLTYQARRAFREVHDLIASLNTPIGDGEGIATRSANLQQIYGLREVADALAAEFERPDEPIDDVIAKILEATK